MTDNHTNQLEMRWLPVADEHGREHMECVWISPTEAISAAHAA